MTWKNSSLGVSFLHDHHISSSLYEGDYRSWQHLWRGESLLNLSYMQHLFDNKITLMINPGLSLLNYKLHTQPKCQDWTFRTNSWIRYQLHSNHQFSLGFAMGNFQPDISYVNTADQTIDFLRIHNSSRCALYRQDRESHRYRGNLFPCLQTRFPKIFCRSSA